MGRFCETPFCHPQCLHGGVCIAPDECECPPGYQGPLCEGGKIFIKSLHSFESQTPSHIPLSLSLSLFPFQVFANNVASTEVNVFKRIHVNVAEDIMDQDVNLVNVQFLA